MYLENNLKFLLLLKVTISLLLEHCFIDDFGIERDC